MSSTTIATDTPESLLRFALNSVDVAFTRNIKHTGWVADRYDRIEAFAKGRAYVAGYDDEWESLMTNGQGGFYFDDTWTHPETGEDLPTWLGRILWDHTSPIGQRNFHGLRLMAFVKRPGTWMTVEKGN